ncbi:MAG: hypothetical protein WCQ99_16275 [Pseudomonadota bacterium]
MQDIIWINALCSPPIPTAKRSRKPAIKSHPWVRVEQVLVLIHVQAYELSAAAH